MDMYINPYCWVDDNLLSQQHESANRTVMMSQHIGMTSYRSTKSKLFKIASSQAEAFKNADGLNKER